MSQRLKVVKLKSGDNLIAELTESSKTSLKLFRPMEIKYMNFVDGLGRRHEAMVLTDWLKSTTTNEFVLDKDFIIGIFTPNPDVLKTYSKQKQFDDRNNETMDETGFANLFGDIEKQIKNMSTNDILKELKNLEAEEQNEEGLQSPEDMIRNIIQENQKEKLIDEEADPKYGTSYCDWSPDPEDYLS